MKGINPLYFKLINSTTILLILVPSMLHTVDFKTAISVAILLGAIILIVIYYNWKKISKINKGKIIKSVKGKIGNWHYLLAGLLLAGVGGYLVMAISWTMAFIILLGFIISDFNQSYNITIYEKGVVFDGLAYYDWNEINKIDNGGKLTFKIKNIPKEIVIIDKN
ncbi:hypothetical protein Mjas_02515 [Methanothermococcus sp. Ax23]|uniref:hypothetical protein n=1 Tax=Methanothermococcus sp. Ax23 TaxID=3156486 RepID=UPI003BA113FA